jgi:hypothetical protein
VTANKVTHIINCAGSQVPNHWIPLGVKYLTFNWLDNNQQILFDAKDTTTNQCYNFIEEALSNTESILVHSVRGQNRACCVIAVFLMRRYRWTLMKALEFLNYRRPDLEIRPSFIQQLAAYELRITRNGQGPKTSTWAEVYDQSVGPENEEVMLRNTYINALLLSNLVSEKQKKQKKGLGVQWIDKTEHKQDIEAKGNDEGVDKMIRQVKSIIIKDPEVIITESDKPEHDIIAIPIVRNEIKQRKTSKKDKKNTMDRKYKDEILEIVDWSAKCVNEDTKKESMSHIINNNINSIIIQNPQNIEVNTFISRAVNDKKFIKPKKVRA